MGELAKRAKRHGRTATNGHSRSGSDSTIWIVLGVLVIMLIVAWGVYQLAQDQAAVQATEKKTYPIPVDVTFSVLEEDATPGEVRNVNVQLNRRVSMDVLENVAWTLRDADSRKFRRTELSFQIAGMEEAGYFWAVASIDPDLHLEQYGFTPEQYERLCQPPENSERRLIGRWLDETPQAGGPISIYREGGRLLKEDRFRDSSVFVKELVEKPSESGQCFAYKENDKGISFVIDHRGRLLIQDQSGLVSALPPAR